MIKRCIHCGAELKTTKEKQDNVCTACATALLDDDCFEQIMDEAMVELGKEDQNEA